MGVVGWKTVAEVDGFHGGEERVGGVVVVEVARASYEWPVRMRLARGGRTAYRA